MPPVPPSLRRRPARAPTPRRRLPYPCTRRRARARERPPAEALVSFVGAVSGEPEETDESRRVAGGGHVLHILRLCLARRPLRLEHAGERLGALAVGQKRKRRDVVRRIEELPAARRALHR